MEGVCHTAGGTCRGCEVLPLLYTTYRYRYCSPCFTQHTDMPGDAKSLFDWARLEASSPALVPTFLSGPADGILTAPEAAS